MHYFSPCSQQGPDLWQGMVLGENPALGKDEKHPF